MSPLRTAHLKYKKIYDDPQLGPVYRPIIPIEIIKYDGAGNELSQRQFVLIDSGADFCMFRGEVGEILGIDVKKGKLHQFQGVGQTKHTGYIHRVGILLAPFDVINVDAIFSYDINEMNIGIVGQKDFFQHFSINFRYMDGGIIVKDR